MVITDESGTSIRAELTEVIGPHAAPEILAENGAEVDVSNLGSVITARTLGKTEETSLEAQRTSCIYRLLQGRLHFSHNRALYRLFSQSHTRYPEDAVVQPSSESLSYGYIADLNRSQQAAVRSLLAESEDLQVALIHGPPGMGKDQLEHSFLTRSRHGKDFGAGCPNRKVIGIIPRLRSVARGTIKCSSKEYRRKTS